MGKNFTRNPISMDPDMVLALLLAEIPNERMKILTFLLFDLFLGRLYSVNFSCDFEV